MSADGAPDEERGRVNFARDVPTTAEDVRVLRRLRQHTPSWLTLSVEEIEALIPPGTLERRPPTPAGRPPFTLE